MLPEKKLMHSIWDAQEKCWKIFLVPENPDPNITLKLNALTNEDITTILNKNLPELTFWNYTVTLLRSFFISSKTNPYEQAKNLYASQEKAPSIKAEFTTWRQNLKISAEEIDKVKDIHNKILNVCRYLSMDEIIEFMNVTQELLDIEIKEPTRALFKIFISCKANVKLENIEVKLTSKKSETKVEDFIASFQIKKAARKKLTDAHKGKIQRILNNYSNDTKLTAEERSINKNIRERLRKEVKSFLLALVEQLKKKIENEVCDVFFNYQLNSNQSEKFLQDKIQFVQNDIPEKLNKLFIDKRGEEIKVFFQRLLTDYKSKNVSLLVKVLKEKILKNATYRQHMERLRVNFDAIFQGESETQQKEGGYWPQRVFNILIFVFGGLNAYFTYQRLTAKRDEEEIDAGYKVFWFSLLTVTATAASYYWNLFSTYKEKRAKQLYDIMQKVLQRLDIGHSEILRKEAVVCSLGELFFPNSQDNLSKQIEQETNNNSDPVAISMEVRKEKLFFQLLILLEEERNFLVYEKVESSIKEIKIDPFYLKIIISLVRLQFSSLYKAQQDDSSTVVKPSKQEMESTNRGVHKAQDNLEFLLEQEETKSVKVLNYLILLLKQKEKLVVIKKFLTLARLIFDKEEKIEQKCLLFISTSKYFCLIDTHTENSNSSFSFFKPVQTFLLIEKLASKIDEVLKEKEVYLKIRDNFNNNLKQLEDNKLKEDTKKLTGDDSKKDANSKFELLIKEILHLDMEAIQFARQQKKFG